LKREMMPLRSRGLAQQQAKKTFMIWEGARRVTPRLRLEAMDKI
jgi:hypothetical protein